MKPYETAGGLPGLPCRMVNPFRVDSQWEKWKESLPDFADVSRSSLWEAVHCPNPMPPPAGPLTAILMTSAGKRQPELTRKLLLT